MILNGTEWIVRIGKCSEERKVRLGKYITSSYFACER